MERIQFDVWSDRTPDGPSTIAKHVAHNAYTIIRSCQAITIA